MVLASDRSPLYRLRYALGLVVSLAVVASLSEVALADSGASVLSQESAVLVGGQSTNEDSHSGIKVTQVNGDVQIASSGGGATGAPLMNEAASVTAAQTDDAGGQAAVDADVLPQASDSRTNSASGSSEPPAMMAPPAPMQRAVSWAAQVWNSAATVAMISSGPALSVASPMLTLASSSSSTPTSPAAPSGLLGHLSAELAGMIVPNLTLLTLFAGALLVAGYALAVLVVRSRRLVATYVLWLHRSGYALAARGNPLFMLRSVRIFSMGYVVGLAPVP